jgi:hypothetical protein
VLVDHGAKLHAQLKNGTHDGNIPLHEACAGLVRGRYSDAVRVLVKTGANPQFAMAKGLPPCSWRLRMTVEETAALLTEAQSTAGGGQTQSDTSLCAQESAVRQQSRSKYACQLFFSFSFLFTSYVPIEEQHTRWSGNQTQTFSSSAGALHAW